jgi:4'-phosphopantetheinyl transferase EntD
MNPAHLSSCLGALFPAGVIAAELRGPGDPALLMPEEAANLGRAVPQRVREFAAGRLCARRALAEFGIVDFPVRVGGDRQPLWPDLMAGSITHTSDFCAAVVAERRCAAELGLDSEVVGDVKPEIWPRICGPMENDWVRSLPVSEQAAAVTLIFAAKEAFYKCQYPVVRERLNFPAARVEVAGWGGSGGVFNIHATRELAIARYAALPMPGRYVFHQGRVSAGVALAGAAGGRAAADLGSVGLVVAEHFDGGE